MGAEYMGLISRVSSRTYRDFTNMEEIQSIVEADGGFEVLQCSVAQKRLNGPTKVTTRIMEIADKQKLEQKNAIEALLQTKLVEHKGQPQDIKPYEEFLAAAPRSSHTTLSSCPEDYKVISAWAEKRKQLTLATHL